MLETGVYAYTDTVCCYKHIASSAILPTLGSYVTTRLPAEIRVTPVGNGRESNVSLLLGT